MDMMRKYIEYIVLFLFLLSCSSKVEILTGDSQYQPFAPDGIPFVVADSMWNVDMRGNHRAVVRVSDINSNTAAIKAMQIIVPKTETMAILVVSFNPKILNSILVPPIEQIYNTTFIKNY